MKLKYIGRHQSVEVPAVGVVVKNGETVDVTGDDAQSLLAQRDQWQRVDAPKTRGDD